MSSWSASAALRDLNAGEQYVFSRETLPLDELLLTLHETRFTGVVEMVSSVSPSGLESASADRLLFREGGSVGVVPPNPEDLRLLSESLVQLKLVSQVQMTNLLREHADASAVRLGKRLLAMSVVDQEGLDRAFAEQARRRVFQLYDLPSGEVTVREGIERLAAFHPIFVDLRPAIAFGLVVRASQERKEDMLKRVAHKRAWMLAPYDEQRNSYGLPPPVLAGLRGLAERSVRFGEKPLLEGLSRNETAGVLLLLDRTSLLHLEPL